MRIATIPGIQSMLGFWRPWFVFLLLDLEEEEERGLDWDGE